MQKVAILSGGNSQYSDLLAPSGDLYYQIEAVGNISCNPATLYNASLSNVAEHKATGIISKTQEFSFVVYPNPVKSRFTVQTQASLQGSQFELISPLGVVLKTFDAAIDREYDISELPEGIYYIRLLQNFKSYNVRIIKL